MQWLIDIVKKWIIAQGYLTSGYVDRGDPAAYDFETEDFIQIGEWQTFDLSATVPEGAKAVLLMFLAIPVGVGRFIQFRRLGNSEIKVIAKTISVVTGVEFDAMLVVAVDDDRKIECRTSAAAFDVISVSICGWWF